MKPCISFMVLLGIAGAALGGRPPGHAATQTIIPDTTDAIVAEVVSASTSRDRNNRYVDVTIKPTGSLWGDVGEGVIKIRYSQYIPVYPNRQDFMPYFSDFTGSGIEFGAKEKKSYIFFLKKEKEGYKLWRMEPVANRKKILELREKLGKEKEEKEEKEKGE